MLRLMRDMLNLIWWVIIGRFRSRASLEAEIVALRVCAENLIRFGGVRESAILAA